MPFAFLSHSLRQVLPRREIREIDRRPGAYPVKSKTGDRTRTGRNNVYFDDTRTVLFMTGVAITYPTTLQFDPSVVSYDLTSSIGSTIGNVNSFAVDQFIPHRAQTEAAGPFVENKLFEQDEHGVVNSNFMTGAAYNIAPERFKSGLSSKTIIRLEYPLAEKSTMNSLTSSMMYFNPTAGRFETIVKESTFNFNQGRYPNTFAPILFTPYGFHYLPLNEYSSDNYGDFSLSLKAEDAYKRLASYAGDGSDGEFYAGGYGGNIGYVTASVLNPSHQAHSSQSIKLSSRLANPFLLEKIVVEMPFEAGPGWLNDNFGTSFAFASDLSNTIDAGGPMITFALLRQDKAGNRSRDLIASATITTQNDMLLGNYKFSSIHYGGAGGYDDEIYTHEGVAAMRVNPTIVITGSDGPAGAANYFTGTLKFTMDPQITSHVQRLRVSGSAYWAYNSNGGSQNGNETQALALVFGPIARRSASVIESGRNVLGNQFALIKREQLSGLSNPINVVDNQHENLEQDTVAPRFARAKVYTDVVSKTIKSPYLLYPDDDLVLCLSKHRSAGSQNSDDWDFFTDHVKTAVVSHSHDVGVGTGNIKITLYGDLIKEDHEYHDTLNQRLETVELWQTIGEDPVLDQFDVTYRDELSGSYVDRFSVRNAITYANELTSSLEMSQYYSHFANVSDDSSSWSTEKKWSTYRRLHELKKSSRHKVLSDANEFFWDSRLVFPNDVLNSGGLTSSPSYYFTPGAGNRIISTAAGGVSSGINAYRWFMSYPFEPIYSNARSTMETLLGDNFNISGRNVFVKLEDFQFEMSDLVMRAEGIDGLVMRGVGNPEFVKYFYGIGNGHGTIDNQFVEARTAHNTVGMATMKASAILRGWKYGMVNGFPQKSTCVFRRDHFGQMRDMLEQRLDTKFYEKFNATNANATLKTSAVEVRFYDSGGRTTDPLKTLSSNVSTEATSSFPYSDGQARNRPAYGDDLNILSITV